MAMAVTNPGRVPFQRLRIIFALILREMGAKTGESRWSYLWAVAEPLGGIVLLTIAFGIMLVRPPIGHNFALFYATGVMPFSLYSAVAATVANSLQANRGLLTYPVVTILDTILARWILETLTNIVIALVLFTGIFWIYDLHLILRYDRLIQAFGVASLLGLGVGTLNCVLFFYFPIWRNIWSILNRPMFLISAVMFTFDSLPPDVRAWMHYNPLIHVVGEARVGFFGTYRGDYVNLPYVLGFSAALFLLGAILIQRNHARLIQN